MTNIKDIDTIARDFIRFVDADLSAGMDPMRLQVLVDEWCDHPDHDDRTKVRARVRIEQHLNGDRVIPDC